MNENDEEARKRGVRGGGGGGGFELYMCGGRWGETDVVDKDVTGETFFRYFNSCQSCMITPSRADGEYRPTRF